MGYNLTQATVERWRPVLDRLVEIKEPVKIETNDPPALAYRLREALAAARAIGFVPFDTLELKFHTVPGYVIAEPKKELVAVIAGEVATRSTQEHSFLDARDAFQVAEAILKASPQLKVLNFPSFAGELEPVRRVAEARGFDVETEPVLTLRRKEAPC